MTWPVSGSEAGPAAAEGGSAAAESGELQLRTGRDGSFSLWSHRFQEGFHSARGALREAEETFLHPSQLARFQPGDRIVVLEVCVGTGSNLAVLLEACRSRGLRLEWTGLELDPRPLRLALAQAGFRAAWQRQTLAVLEQLLQRGSWQYAGESRGRMLWGDARRTLLDLSGPGSVRLDLVWHDAFSPQRCPELWSVEFLSGLSQLLGADARWISYCSAAAVRQTLKLAGLQLAALESPATVSRPYDWSGGTVASPAPLPASSHWRMLTPMEWEHLGSSAGEPYRDPGGTATAAEILTRRRQAQAEALASGRRGSSSAWRRRWGLKRQGRAAEDR
jgi:tRNA U34 5-methylaminomethyl-2-thiouridine-forming methyltransferase MnmC